MAERTVFVKVVSHLLLLAGVVREITSHRKGFKTTVSVLGICQALLGI